MDKIVPLSMYHIIGNHDTKIANHFHITIYSAHVFTNNILFYFTEFLFVMGSCFLEHIVDVIISVSCHIIQKVSITKLWTE